MDHAHVACLCKNIYAALNAYQHHQLEHPTKHKLLYTLKSRFFSSAPPLRHEVKALQQYIKEIEYLANMEISDSSQLQKQILLAIEPFTNGSIKASSSADNTLITILSTVYQCFSKRIFNQPH